MAQTIVEKIGQAHLADAGPGRPVQAGDIVSIRPDHVMTHDNTSAVMLKFQAVGATRMADPAQPVFTLDHNIQDRSDKNLAKYAAIASFAREMGVTAYPAGAGIGHQLMVEQGYVVPGAFVVASDSHSNTYGALGAIGTPVVRTDAAAIWATGEFWWKIPRTVCVELTGQLREGVTGKDLVITLCGLHDSGEVLNAALEFTGPGVTSLDMEARLTIANMSTEWGALVAWFPVDEVTLGYLRGRCEVLAAQGIDRLTEADLAGWSDDPPRPDTDVSYAAVISLDLDAVAPRIAGPDSVLVTAPLAEVEPQRIPVQKAYVVSCVNSRLGDLEAAARVLAGQRVADGVSLYVAAASLEIEDAAKASGVWQTLIDAGAHVLPPGCGPCIGLGTGLLEAGETGISATNRNFKGRMGSRDAKCYLASPEVVAASAIAGFIRGPTPVEPRILLPHFRVAVNPVSSGGGTETLEGFPERVRGRLVYLPQDNLNTDGIYGKDYTYREDMTPDEMAAVVMQNYDPEFVDKVRPGDVLVAGSNFGTGSSREQAATALIHKGIPLVIAASYSDTYLRNAFNNGFLCIADAWLPGCLAEEFAAEVARGTKTIVPGDDVEIDFTQGRVTWRGETSQFASLSRVAQALIVAGGVENLIRKRLSDGRS